jgi:hypothetical protein
MARVSFTLRKTGIDRGSYARYDIDVFNTAASAGNAASAGTWVVDDDAGSRDTDTALRSDNYQIPPNEFVESFLEATAVAYGVVSVAWGANLPSEDLSSTPIATSAILVYSSAGPPATVSSGDVLAESSTDFAYEHTGLEGGRWAYYTLFIKYESTTADPYYEPVASIEVLVPYNYGSTALLWRRVPQYYREADTRIGDYIDPTSEFAITELGGLPVGNKVGPLYRFLAIFGFEMDRVRTIVDYLMISKDPAEANSETLDAVANTVGLGFSSNIINTERLRAILDDIGYLRRGKGTVDGVANYGRAFSGSEIEVDQLNREIKFYAQRVNYITDPLDATGLVTHRPAHEVEAVRPRYNRGSYDPTTYVAGNSATYPSKGSDESYVPGMYWTAASATTFEGIPVGVGDYIVAYDDGGSTAFAVHGNDFAATNYSAYTTYSVADADYTPNSSGASVGVTHVMFHIDCPIPVKEADSVAFSVHSTIGTSGLKWVRLVDESGNIVGWSDGVTRAGDSPAAEAIAAENLDGEWAIAFIEFLVDMSAISVYQLKYLLAERNRLGEYFDGSFTRGGWILDPAGNSTSDYRWSSEGSNNGNAYESISVYSEDYRRTRSLLDSYFRQSLPVTVSEYYTFTAFDAIPGMDAIDTYLTP